jgi:tRNA modification GTPase
MNFDTIAAVSTPLGEGGIAVIRVSGDDAIAVVEHIFASKTKLSEAESHTVHYGHIMHPESKLRVEEALVTLMRAPRSYTMENVVEISCHGGIISVKRVLDLLLEQQIRLAEPGEFTKRAFLNGRIDLSQAEAVMDLIRAKSDRAFQVALKQVEGALSKAIKRLRHELVELMAHIEVNIDYPEHDVEEMTNAFIKNKCIESISNLQQLLNSSQKGKIMREGITTAIVGRPNVGKSSLLNTLAQDNRAIVTDIPGTTRDVIEEYVNVKGIPLRLLDTAGIRETTDKVEKIGVERSRNAIHEADLILFVVDGSVPLQPDDYLLIEDIKHRQTVVIINKQDLDQRIEMDAIKDFFPEPQIVRTSLLEEQGIEELDGAISGLFFSGKLESQDLTYVSNARHISLLKQAMGAMQEALDATEQMLPIDMIQIDIRNAWEYLGDIIGDSSHESLIDQIFSQFCLGK